MLTTSDFILMEYYYKLFKAFKGVTIELSSKKGVSISKVIVLTNALLSHIKMILKMEKKAEKRFSGIEENSIFSEASLLDPR